jgi:hypothetical protein
MFRRVDLPARIPGRLLLYSMPGRYEAIETVWHQVRSETIGAIVCLAEKDEIHEKSSEYARALEAGTVPCSVLRFQQGFLTVARPRIGVLSGRLQAT